MAATPSRKTNAHAPLQSAKARLKGDRKPAAHICPAGGSRKGATQARARETVDAILEAAARILETKGYRAASTNAIARLAGVSVGSLYQYFSSREDIFMALRARHRDAIYPVIYAALERLHSDRERPSTVLEGLLQDLLTAHAGRPQLMHAMDAELTHLLPPEAIREEEEGLAVATRLMATRIKRPPEEALASAWLAGEITAMVSRRLAHEPPEWVDVAQVQVAFARVMQALVG